MSVATVERVVEVPDKAETTTSEPRFEIHSVAISWVDPKKPRKKPPHVQTGIVDFAGYGKEEKGIIQDFMDQHLSRAWDLPETGRTRSAIFAPRSPIAETYDELRRHPRKLLSEARNIANHLLEVTPKAASRGVLLTIWFNKYGEAKRPHLGLLKLEPGKRDTVFLEKNAAGELLKIAVEHQEYALPEPGERVLKWAITPHPNPQSRYEIKLRDEQNRGDPASYFVEFLACTEFFAERDQAAAAIEELLGHTQDKGRLQRAENKVPRLVAKAEAASVLITEDEVVEWAVDHRLVSSEEGAEFRRRLSASKARGMKISPKAFQNLKMKYHLTVGDGVTISGRLADLLSYVTVRRGGPEFLFTIATPKYRAEVKP